MSQELRKVCPHCGERLAPRTLREHTRLFFNASSRTWLKKRRVASSTEADAINTGTDGFLSDGCSNKTEPEVSIVATGMAELWLFSSSLYTTVGHGRG